MATPALKGRDRRASPRVSLEVPLALEWRGDTHRARTALVNINGALVLSPVFCPLKTTLKVRNLMTGGEAQFRVVWSWVDQSQSGVKCRLALAIEGQVGQFWGPGYEAARQAD